jgi:hypothetical protein
MLFLAIFFFIMIVTLGISFFYRIYIYKISLRWR